ncbi:protein kinase [Streptomyces sp. NPDC059385]|uniref:protein kinase domain-containing protein n=1 Tax=Streptomyces sp. NPDC059385 TaxID=3346817 RepID=UPI0036BDE113
MEALRAGDPERVGAYWPAARLGSGGQGVVYEAYDNDGTRVAVKLLHHDAHAFVRDRFVKELAAARRVASFCTARILDAEAEGERPYIVSEYIPGPTLGEQVREQGPLPADEVLRLAIGTATALAAIHQAGVVHRDLKPGNVLLGPDGPRVIDFGIARTSDMSLTATGAVMGTYGYIAPEVLAGLRAGPAADLFAWGALVLYAASGQEPFRGENIGEVAHRTATLDPDLSAVPSRLRSLVAAALAKEPDRRPEAVEILQGLVGRMPASADPRLALLQAGARTAVVPTREGGASAPRAADAGLGERAERAYGALPDAYHLVARSLLLRLVVPGGEPDGSQDTTRTASAEELYQEVSEAEAAAMRTVVEALAAAGVLAAAEDGSVRPVSAALLPAWPRLRGWVLGDRDGLVLHNRLGEAAAAWQRGGLRDEDLQQGSALRVTLDWAATAPPYLRPNPLENRFLDGSRTAAARTVRRRRQLLASLSVFVVAALAAGLFAVQQTREVRVQQARATARATAQAAQSLRASDPVNAMLLSLAAWRISPTEEARAALLAAAAQRETDIFQVPLGVRDLEQGGQQLSADGRLLSLSIPGRGQIWDVAARKQLLSLDRIDGLKDAFIEDLSSHGRYALAHVTGTEGQVLDLATQAPVGPRLKLGEGPSSVNDRGQVITVKDKNGGYEIRDAVAGGRLISVEGLDIHAELSPEGDLLATCNPAPQLSLWRLSGSGRTQVRLEDPPERSTLNCFGSGRSRMRFSPDGSRLMAGDAAFLRVWDTATGKVVSDMELENVASGDTPKIRGLTFSTDGRHLIGYSAGQGVSIWRLGVESGPVYSYGMPDLYGRYVPDRYLSYAVAGEGTPRLVISSHFGSRVQTLDLSRALAKDELDLPDTGVAAAVALSPDARYGVVRTSEDGFPMQVYDTGSGWLLGGRIRRRAEEPRVLDDFATGDTQALSEDGRLLAFQDQGPDIVVWDVREGREVLRERVGGDGDAINSLALSPDGSRVAAWTGKNVAGHQVQVWDVPRRIRLRSFPDAQGLLVFSPDARTLVSGHGEVLDLESGAVRAGALGSTALTGATFSADGRTLATTTAEGWVELRRTDGWNVIARMPSSTAQGGGHYGEQFDKPTLTADGRLLAARVGRATVQFWDVPSRLALGDALYLSGDTVQSLRFDDRGVLRMIGNGHRHRTFDPGPESAITEICRRAGRDLTPEVWRTYVQGAAYRRVCL